MSKDHLFTESDTTVLVCHVADLLRTVSAAESSQEVCHQMALPFDLHFCAESNACADRPS